jgi:hypothetical protein
LINLSKKEKSRLTEHAEDLKTANGQETTAAMILPGLPKTNKPIFGRFRDFVRFDQIASFHVAPVSTPTHFRPDVPVIQEFKAS